MGAPHKLSPSLLEFDSGADPEAISMIGLQSNHEPVVVVQRTILVQKKPNSAIVVGDNDVHCAIIVDVPESGAAAHFRQCKRRSSRLGHFLELLSLALIMKQLIWLAERVRDPSQGLYAIHGAVGDKQIELSIIVIVKPFGAETCVRKGRQDQAKFRGSIVKICLPIIDEEVAAFIGQVGFKDVLMAVALEIPSCNAHAGLR